MVMSRLLTTCFSWWHDPPFWKDLDALELGGEVSWQSPDDTSKAGEMPFRHFFELAAVDRPHGNIYEGFAKFLITKFR